MTKCMKCQKEAVYYRSYSGEKLCKRHFLESIERKVSRTIAKYKMFRETDRIGVGLSGGKDSIVLLYILKKIEQRFPKSSLVAITIDEGIVGYRDEGLKIASKITSELEIEHVVSSFKKIFGYSLEDILNIYKTESDISHSACYFCGIFRRRSLNQLGREIQADKLAIGHNLDDEAQTILMNIVRSDIIRLARTNLKNPEFLKYFVPRVKPLRNIPERETTAYAFFQNLPFHARNCPYATGVLRNDIQKILNQMEQKRPGIKHSILRSGEKLKQLIQIKQQVHCCPICHEPATDKICRFCQIMQKLQKTKKQSLK
ncbi:MAG: TIGR00269 family protein [Candidatus Helarchaeota archaeon]